jgi:hypothetical protein
LLIERTYPHLTVDWVAVEHARTNGYAFPPTDTREQSISLPIMLDGKLAAVLLMIFMARVHSHAAVIDKYLSRLRNLAAAIGEAASVHLHGVPRSSAPRDSGV